jgi:predicted SprT family Zn-dependent metalloprotease
VLHLGTMTMNDDDDDDDDLFLRKQPLSTKKKPQPQPQPKKKGAAPAPGGPRPSIDDTLMFKRNTKSKKLLDERAAVTAKLYRKFNEVAFGNQLPADLPVVWSKRLTSTAGLTKMSFESGTGKKRGEIILSEKVVDDVLRLKTTLLHEMCHAAAWFIDNTRKPPHGASFWKWASISTASTGLTVTTCHSYVVHKPYVFQCVNVACQTKYGRHSKSIDVTKHCCGVCKGKLEYVGSFNADGTPKRAR